MAQSRTIGNRPPQYVLEYDLVFDLPRKRVQKKVTKKVDNSEKTVTLKKTRTKKTNTTGVNCHIFPIPN